MMRADIFALLNIANSIDFIPTATCSIHLKKTILKFLETEDNEKAIKQGWFKSLSGWNKLMH